VFVRKVVLAVCVTGSYADLDRARSFVAEKRVFCFRHMCAIMILNALVCMCFSLP